MALPGNGIYVVRGEMSTLMTAMKRGARWNSTSYQDDEQDGLMKQFADLKQILNHIEDLRMIEPNVFLSPFLNVIRTEETTGAVTSLALSAVNKFLLYGLIDPTHPTLAATVDNIADAVTHARFLGTDQASDGVTLMRVVEVLHTLMRSPEGNALTNESVCEVMLSCFKICFEPRLNELLRKTAEQALKDMVLLLFIRLPQFSEDRYPHGLFKKFKMMSAESIESEKRRKPKGSQKHQKISKTSSRVQELKSEENLNKLSSTDETYSPNLTVPRGPPLATTPETPAGNIVDMQGKITQTPIVNECIKSSKEDPLSPEEKHNEEEQNLDEGKLEDSTEKFHDADIEEDLSECKNAEFTGVDGEYINSVGVRFTNKNSLEGEEPNPLVPYGLPCIQELFRFLILLCNPLDKQNTDTMMHMGLNLLTVAFEVGADNIGKYETLLSLVKDEMCRNLFSLLNSERLTIFAADLQVCFLVFESLRSHLKFQLEYYLTKLSEIIASENPRTPYEFREQALDNLLQLWRIPGFVTELYINYDCNLYCTDVFENLAKLLSKQTLTATSSIYSIHTLSLDALITVIENIEKNCATLKAGKNCLSNMARHSHNNSKIEGITIEIEEESNKSDDENIAVENISSFIKSKNEKGSDIAQKVTKEELVNLKNKKRILNQGTDLFNQRPDKGIQFLQENGILNPVLDPKEIAWFLRENPGLDKKMIGEYISKRKNVESKILENFVESFDFANMRIDQALRLYLETFRLPGEAPLIFLVMEHFADHWHKCNNEPFANTDAAFRLAYAIIMLNMDQHNHNAKRLNVPMTCDDFCRNLRGLNGNGDFDQEMLMNIYNSIKNEEIVMPAEQTGLVKENYLWKVLLRRGVGKDGQYSQAQDSTYDKDLFNIVWGPSLTALSFMYDKSSEVGYQKSLAGFTKCAGILAFYNLNKDFDALILTLCKFTTFSNIPPEANEINVAVTFGMNHKAQAAMKTTFRLIHDYGDCLREGWKNIMEVIVQLFRLKLLPKSMMEVEDFCEKTGKTTLILEKPCQKTDAGLLSSLYSYLSSEGNRQPTYEEQEIIKAGKKCIRECQIDQIISESKFIQFESLNELFKTILSFLKPPSAHKSVGIPYSEDIVVFWMEFLVKIVIHNRDRIVSLWSPFREQIYLLLMGSSSCGYEYLLNRTTIALLKLAIYLMRNEELCPIVLQSLKVFLMLKPSIIFRISKQISFGMYELLKTSAQNIHTETDWQIVFTILECVGAGAAPPEFEDGLPLPGTKSDGALSSEEDSGLPDRGYISDSEVINAKSAANSPTHQPLNSPNGENWILVNKDSEMSVCSRPQSPIVNSLVYPCKLLNHSPCALFKCWDSLSFIVRNVAHITPYNFESCVKCIRVFVEAVADGGIKARKKMTNGKNVIRRKSLKRDTNKIKHTRKGDENCSSESEDEDLSRKYETLAIQLLDLMYMLYTRTAQIFRWWAEEGCSVPQCSALWEQGWCPILQGIARLALDRRREVRTQAISCLQQRALLVHDLQTLTGAEWACCFKQVLFPLLNELLPDSTSISNTDQILLEETRIRMATIMSKVFLHHLTPLIQLPTFNELWLEILDYIEKFMKVPSDMLYEQMLEILKNMLLVMHSVRVFHCSDGNVQTPLWQITWKKIGEFLPNLKDELFKEDTNQIKTTNKVNSSIEGVDIKNNPSNLAFVSEASVETIQSISSSTKGSIILQPLEDSIVQKPLIFSQSLNHQQNMNVPILIPQANIYQHQFQQSPSSEIEPKPIIPAPYTSVVYSNISPVSSTLFPSSIEEMQTQSSLLPESNQKDSKLPDLISDTSISAPANNHERFSELNPSISENNFISSVYQIKTSKEFSIELPDLPELTTKPVTLNKNLENLQKSNSDIPFGSYQSETVRSEFLPSSSLEDEPRIPISHLIAGNQYPSLKKDPPPSIVQSFSPIYVPNSIQSPPPGGHEMFLDYVQNPYNLTLQQENIEKDDTHKLLSSGNIESGQENVVQLPNVFQSSNYFSGIDQDSIPPGSEVLFGRP